MSAVFPAGTILNQKYQIEQVLSTKGGMGLLYIAFDRNQQRVAIKRNREITPEAREQFKREADLLLPLHHPNLVRVEDFFEDITGAQYLVMEYIPGSDLDDLMNQRGKAYDENQVIEWGKILCSVLGYLHKQNPPIIHRDLKPGNVKIKPDGVLVLVDFGIAKILQPGQKTQRGARAITPGYAPIEQYGAGTDQRSDIYSLGAVLYFLLTRRVPLDAPTRLNYPDLDLSGLGPAIAPILIKSLAIKQPDRYQSADEMSAALLSLPSSISIPVSPTKTCSFCGKLNRDTAIFCYACGKQVSAIALTTCPRCAATLRSNAKFCPGCGLRLMPVNTPSLAQTVICPHCSSINRITAKYCLKCGYLLLPSHVPPPVPLRPATVPPLPPLQQFNPVPSTPGMCPSCGHANAPSEPFCQYCGYTLKSMPVPAPMPASQPKPPVPIAPLPEQKTVGWLLFAVGVLTVLFAVWLVYNSAMFMVAVPLTFLGIFTAIAGRDLLGLFEAYRYRVPSRFALAFGDTHRGRRWGAIATTLWMIIGTAFAWLVLPLALIGGMLFALNVLVSERFAQSIGAHYARPGWVIVIGWLLTFSGIGTVPGIALLIPKVWAKRVANIALVTLGFVSVVGVMVSIANLGISPQSLPVNWTVPGTNTSALIISALASSLGIFVGVIAALKYLATAQVAPSTATARRRELSVAAWTLFGVGWVTFIATFTLVAITNWGGVFWLGLGIGVLAIVGARDMLDLGTNQVSSLPLLTGSMARGRRLGIIAASALAVVSITFAWLVWTWLLLIAALFLLYELMSDASQLECGETPDAPPGVTLIGWALALTGIGIYPGIQMLRREKAGWQWSRPALAGLMILGLLIAGWAITGGATTAFVTPTLASCGIGMSIASACALTYIGKPNVKKYFRI